MRNDVKFGFAIGGVLLAVLIVYVLVVPGGSNSTRQAKLDQPANPEGKVTFEPTSQPIAPPAAPVGSFTPPGAVAGGADQEDVLDNEVAFVDDTPEPPPPAKSSDIDWAKLLNGQQVLMNTPQAPGETLTAQGGEGRDAGIAQADLTSDASTPLAPFEPDRPIITRVDNSPPPPQAPTPARMTIVPDGARPANLPGNSTFSTRTHVVQANETLSSISAAAYGNPNVWPAIVKANPGIDPNRLKVGATIKLPDAKEIQAAEPQPAAARIAAQPIDPRKQYRVEPGDSLYSISLKLYGKAGLSDRIYEVNKQAIGPDPSRLKLGQVLQLPEPPTQSVSR